MTYLFLAILSMSVFMLTLKYISVKGINVAQAIIVNYVLAASIGVFRVADSHSIVSVQTLFANDWWYLALLSGALFFTSMHIMAASTRVAGVTITTISSRVALVIPILFSAVFLGERFGGVQAAGIALAAAAIVLMFYNRNEKHNVRNAPAAVALPLTVFATMGAIAVCMKYSQHIIAGRGNHAADYPVYEAANFITALLCAVIYYAVRHGKTAFAFSWRSIAAGLGLGVFNFLVTFAILNGLRYVDTGTFYVTYNISVVVITALVGRLAFGEKLTPLKVAGIVVALGAITVLML